MEQWIFLSLQNAWNLRGQACLVWLTHHWDVYNPDTAAASYLRCIALAGFLLVAQKKTGGATFQGSCFHAVIFPFHFHDLLFYKVNGSVGTCSWAAQLLAPWTLCYPELKEGAAQPWPPLSRNHTWDSGHCCVGPVTRVKLVALGHPGECSNLSVSSQEFALLEKEADFLDPPSFLASLAKNWR